MYRVLSMAFCLFLAACDVTYIADSADPRLPHFSKIGRNAAGAYLNDVPWRASCGPSFRCNVEDLIYLESEDYTELRLPRAAVRYEDDGDFQPTSYMRIVFRMDGDQLENIKNVRSGEALTFMLDAELNTVEMGLDQSGIHGNITSSNGIGQLHFRYSEASDNGRYIIAGTFGFLVDDETGYYRVSSGRFDFRFTI